MLETDLLKALERDFDDDSGFSPYIKVFERTVELLTLILDQWKSANLMRKRSIDPRGIHSQLYKLYKILPKTSVKIQVETPQNE